MLVLAASFAVSGCRGSGFEEKLSVAAGRDVAERFAEAIVAGDGDAAVALLVHPGDEALTSTATRVAAAWKEDAGAVVRMPGTRSGRRWTFTYVGRRTHRDGRFEDVSGQIIVVLSASSKGPAVKFFALRNENIRFSTHHDSVLLPSNR